MGLARPILINESWEGLNLNQIIELKNIDKNFFGVQALKNVDFSVNEGEIHCLVGENGAGKSTLVKIISGVYQKDGGEIYFKGEKVKLNSPLHAQKSGISVIYQEFNLVNGLTVGENIFMGREILNKFGMIDWKRLNSKSKKILDRLGVDISPTERIKNLSVAEQQFVEIAKALSYGSDLIIMDEPSATLTPEELDRLFNLISNLKEEGVSIVYISHKIEEIMEIGDRVTVLRDGEKIGTEKIENMNRDKIIEWMVGRPLDESFPERIKKNEEIVLQVNNLSRKDKLHDINFSLHRGEILGIAGLVGAGRTELLRAIYGADSIDSGEIKVNGKNIAIYSPQDALKSGIGLLPEDRKQQGLILNQSLRNNLTLPDLDKITNKFLIDIDMENKELEKHIDDLNIKTSSKDALVKSLSGGNQQKVVIAKLLYTDVDILLFDEPTRGIDVGAKREIYKLMDALTKEGKSIIMISSELPEVLGMSDRVLVMNEGHIANIYDNDELSQEEVMKSATKEVN